MHARNLRNLLTGRFFLPRGRGPASVAAPRGAGRAAARPATRPGVACQAEPLEGRLLMSTINWVNQGSDASDSDGFNAVFGTAVARQARLNVGRAIADWQKVIVRFDPAADYSYDLSLQAAAIDGNPVANGGGGDYDDRGRPHTGTINILNNAGMHWVDPSPNDDGEFTDRGANGWTGFAPGIAGTDLYATVLHELGHALGFIDEPKSAMGRLLVDTGINDPAGDFTNDDGSPRDPGNLFTVNVFGGPVEATFTGDDGGHLFEGPAVAGRPDLPVHPDAAMNPGRSLQFNERNLISDLEAALLRDVYGYQVRLPSTIDSMLTFWDQDTHTLTVNGQPGDVADTITVTRTTLATALKVTVGTWSEIVPAAEAVTININGGGGHDTINLGRMPTGRTVNVDGGAGTNTLNLVGSSATDFVGMYGGTAVTFDGSTVNVAGVAALNAKGNGGDDQFIVQGGALPGVAVTLEGGENNDSFSVYDTGARVSVNGDNGDDTIVVDDRTTILPAWNGGGGAGDTYVIDDERTVDPAGRDVSTNYVVSPGVVTATRPATGGVRNFTLTGTEKVTINGTRGNDEFRTVPGAPTLSAYGEGGDDRFVLGGGSLLANGLGGARVNGLEGDDTLVLDDSAAAANSAWTVDPDTVTVAGVRFDYTGFEGVELRMGGGNNPCTIRGTSAYTGVTALGGGGNDTFSLPAYAGSRARVEGQGGYDTVTVDDRNLPLNTTAADLSAYSILRYGLGAASTVAYGGCEGLTYYTRPGTFDTSVYSTSPEITGQTTVFCAGSYNGTPNGGPARVTVYPHDEAGNLTIASNIGFGGGGLGRGDVLVVQDYTDPAATPAPINYRVYQPYGAHTTNVGGLGAGLIGTSGFDALVLNGGPLADTFDVEQHDPRTLVGVYAGGGDDTINIGTGVIDNAVYRTVTVDGGEGDDALTYNDHGAGGAGHTRPGYPEESYTVEPGRVSHDVSDANLGDYNLTTVDYAGLERYTIDASDNDTTFHLRGTDPATPVALVANGGFNALDTAGAGGVLDGVRSPVTFAGDGSKFESVVLDDSADDTGDTAHVGQGAVGAAAGDDLFGPGGSLTYTGVSLLTVNFGTGQDTVFAAPDAATTLFVNAGANGPDVADGLTVVAPAASNPVLTGGEDGLSGAYTFDDRRSVNFTDVESLAAVEPDPEPEPDPQPPATIAGRHVFYNRSVYDGADPAANELDDSAVAPGKEGLLPGGTATFANYTSYSRGLNGVMVDVLNLPADVTPGADDFRFLVGNGGDDPSAWADAPPPAEITVRRGAGAGGSDRVTLVWPDGAVRKTWLQVTVNATANTGLAAQDVFYFGNAIGETFNSTTQFKVDSQDATRTRNAQSKPTTIAGLFDHDRDGRVNTTDLAIARNGQGFSLTPISIPAAAPTALTGDALPAAGKPKRRAAPRPAAGL